MVESREQLTTMGPYGYGTREVTGPLWPTNVAHRRREEFQTLTVER